MTLGSFDFSNVSFSPKKIHLAEIVGFCIIGKIKISLCRVFQKNFFVIFHWPVITFLIIKKIKNKFFGKNSKS
jgi:hypothetical protein